MVRAQLMNRFGNLVFTITQHITHNNKVVTEYTVTDNEREGNADTEVEDQGFMKDVTTKNKANIKSQKPPRTKKTEQPPLKKLKNFREASEKIAILIFHDNLREQHRLKIEKNPSGENFEAYRTREYKEKWDIKWESFRTHTLGNWMKSRKKLQTLVDQGHGAIKSCKRIISTSEPIETKPYFDSDNCVSRKDLDAFTNLLTEKITMDTITKSSFTEKINGSLQINIGLTKDKECAFTKLRAIMKRTTEVLIPTAHDLSLHLTECINEATDSTYVLTSASFLIQPEGSKPQPPHTDVENVGTTNAQLQGTFILTDNSEGTIVYDMTHVPMYPRPEDIAARFDEDYPSAFLCEKGVLLSEVMGNDELKKHFRSWGRVMFTSEERRPTIKKMKKYGMTIMQGNHPHNSPGNKAIRVVIFFTAQEINDNKKDAYSGTQMSKARFILTIIRSVLPSLKNKDDMITIKRLYYAFASTVAEAFKYGSVDGTLELESKPDDFKSVRFRNIINNLERCVDECINDPTDRKKAQVELAKDMVALYIPMKMAEKTNTN